MTEVETSCHEVGASDLVHRDSTAVCTTDNLIVAVNCVRNISFEGSCCAVQCIQSVNGMLCK